MLKPLLRSPANAFAFLAVLTLVVMALAIGWTAHVPGTTFEVRPAGGAYVTVRHEGAAVGRFHGQKEGQFIDRHGRARLRAPLIALVVEWEPRSTRAENLRFYALRGQLSRLMQEKGMQLRLPDGRRLPAHGVSGTFARLKAGTWLSFGIGLAAMLIGLWVVVLRPREWAAQMFMFSGLALCLATITIAVGEQMSLSASAAVQYWNGRINLLSAFLFGLSLTALFARYPLPLVPKRALGMAAAALALFWTVLLFDPWKDAIGAGVAMTLALGVAIVLLAFVQGWKSRHDPALRSAFILIGGSLLSCICIFSAVNLIPQILGRVDVMSVPLATTVFLLFYAALAFAITRYRLFDLGGWAVRVAIFALVVILVLAIDLVLVLLTGAGWTLSAVFLAVAILWLPLRELLLRRIDRRRDRQDIFLLRGASDVAFALRPDAQADRWAALLTRQFAPLTVAPCACAATEIQDDGRILAVPSPLGGTGLALRFAGRGSRLFNSDDKSVADALVALVKEMVAARAAYDQGVRAERQRIARDLHDDVGARLMTSLHREDLGTVQADVREAMADIRLIIDGMAGQDRCLADILADLRHETVNRLQLAGIRAAWPAGALFDDERQVAAAINRALFSVVRELVSNIIRHAGANEAHIDAMMEEDALTLVIRDNGRGFDAGGSSHPGNGLRNVRKRLDELGGDLRIAAGEGGTALWLCLPLASPDRGMAAAAGSP